MRTFHLNKKLMIEEGENMKKNIGILGGMGPAATVTLFDNIVKMTDAKCDQENVGILIDNNPFIPDRTAYILGAGENPIKELVKSAAKLKNAGADFLIMPCNTAHFFYEDIKREADVNMIHLLEETIKRLKEVGFQKIGLLATTGTIKTNIYSCIAEREGIEIVTPDEYYQEKIMKFIYEIKEGKKGEISDFNETTNNLREKGVDTFILGCTELSVANNTYNFNENFMDPLKIISKVAIELAGYKVKK